MNSLISHAAPTLDDVRDELLNSPAWTLPQDINEKATNAIEGNSIFSEPPTQPFFQAPSVLVRVAYLTAAASFQFKGSNGASIAKTIINFLNSHKPTAENIFKLDTQGLNDSSFSDALETLVSKVSLVKAEIKEKGDKGKKPETEEIDEKALLRQPFFSSAVVSCSAVLLERLCDYSMFTTATAAELQSACFLKSDNYTRENSPVPLSLAAQRIRDLTNGSKELKNLGAPLLEALPELFAPTYAALAALRTNIAKPLHLFTRTALISHRSALSLAASQLLFALTNSESDSQTATDKLPEAILAISEKLFAKISELQAQITATEDSKYAKMLEAKKKAEENAAKKAAEKAAANPNADKAGKGKKAAPKELSKPKIPLGVGDRQFFDVISEKGVEFLRTLPVFQIQGSTKAVAKVPVGTRDIEPVQMQIRQFVMGKVREIFKNHGAVEIDTPVFELREVLTEKYGEESKLIYNLEDQGGELLSLRYDLTVPFARYVACHGISQIKRFHIAKVYRRDKPAIERGRFREFYQCDLDIAGSSAPMLADCEVITCIVELLNAVGKVGGFTARVKVSHRQLLKALTVVARVPEEKFKTVCSSIDKLDKQPWAEVRAELVEMKGLSEASADKLAEYVEIRGEPFAVLGQLRQRAELVAVAGKYLDEMELLFKYLQSTKVLGQCDFDLSLARGLDYYTGVIFEASAAETGTHKNVGSISGGGRFDELIGMFSGKKVPAVGASLGIERIFALIEDKIREQTKPSDTQVMVCSVAANLTERRLEVAQQLWEHGIAAEFLYEAKPNIGAQLGRADMVGAKAAIILGPDEEAKGEVKIKNLISKEEKIVPKEKMIEEIVLSITKGSDGSK